MARTESASLRHAELTKDASDKIRRLAELIHTQDIDNPHWGHVGDLAHLVEHLDAALAVFDGEIR